MNSAGMPEDAWVAIVGRYLDNAAYNAYEHWTTRCIGCQTIIWSQLTQLFENQFQEKKLPVNAHIELRALTFTKGKDDFLCLPSNFSIWSLSATNRCFLTSSNSLPVWSCIANCQCIGKRSSIDCIRRMPIERRSCAIRSGACSRNAMTKCSLRARKCRKFPLQRKRKRSSRTTLNLLVL